MEEPCPLDRLPDEVLIRIFSLLPSSDLVSLHRVQNQRMKRLSLDGALTRCLDFSHSYGTEEPILLAFLRLSTSSKILSLAHCFQLRVTPLVRVLRQFKDLHMLDLTNISLTAASLSHILENLPSLEALGISATETVPLDTSYRPLPPFRKSTIAALGRLKHFKYVIGHRCIRSSLLPCVNNVESLVLDFMPFENVFDHCSCCFFIRTPFLSAGIGRLRAVFAPRWILDQVTSHMFMGSVQTYLRTGFVPFTRGCNAVVCLREKHSTRTIKDGVVACDLEPCWTAFVRKDAVDQGANPKISSPFVPGCQDNIWEPVSSGQAGSKACSKPGQTKGVEFLRVCCLPEVDAHLSQKQCTLLDTVHGSPDLEVLEIIIGQGRDCFLTRYETGSNTIDRFDLIAQRSNTDKREYYRDVLRIISESPLLGKVSLTASNNSWKLKKFLIELSTSVQRLKCFSVAFPRSYLNLQLSAQLNLVLPNMKHLCDLRINSSYFQLNAHFIRSLQQCLCVRRICILTRGGKCAVCQKLPSLFSSCERLTFLCLDGFTHDPCSQKQANAVAVAIKQRFEADRPGLVVSHSWRSRPGIPDVHYAEMVANRGFPR